MGALSLERRRRSDRRYRLDGLERLDRLNWPQIRVGLGNGRRAECGE
jgi:hypothetical protein